MAIRLSDEARAEIRGHAARDYPYECCGAMLGTVLHGIKEVTALRPLENEHEEGHERRYLISADSMFRVEKEARDSGLSVVGFYHSHPDHPSRPSAYDREWAWPFYSYIIIAVERGVPAEMTSWTIEDEDSPFQAEEITK
jgi:proteasome lid subunit RPN8/RPN11